jgi:MFS family permease
MGCWWAPTCCSCFGRGVWIRCRGYRQRYAQLAYPYAGTWSKRSIQGLVLILGQIFLWVPTAVYLGVRPTALIALTFCFVTCIWSASTTSFRSLEAARVVCSIAASCGEVLPAIIVKDIFFLHERGRVMGFYLIFFQSMPSIGILMAGFVISGAGWRWWLWVLSSLLITGVYG